MDKILNVSEMRTSDKFTIEVLGVSENELVNRAGKAVSQEILNRFQSGRVLVCVGKGNNGADGKVIFEILSKTANFIVDLLDVENGSLEILNNSYDIIVDCIFGIGINREVVGKYAQAIELINEKQSFVVACDIPSGINGDNGLVMGVAVKADLTIAIQTYKLGHFIGDGLDYIGENTCVDIGISVPDNIRPAKLINHTDVKELFVKRNRVVHKGNFGKACIIGGSIDYTGSVILSSNALVALKMGSGYSNLVVPKDIFSYYVGKIPECTLASLVVGECVDTDTLTKLLKYDAIAIGMGMGVSINVYKVIKFLLENYKGKLIIDADGLNCLSAFGVEILKNKKCKVVLTPHIGEFSRLASVGKDVVLSNPTVLVKNFAKQFDVVVLLKSAVSIISDGKTTFINISGCCGMAKAGSGDVLSGLLCGIMARNNEELKCVCGGAYVFGKAGELAQQEQGNEYTITASDIVKALPKVINSLQS